MEEDLKDVREEGEDEDREEEEGVAEVGVVGHGVRVCAGEIQECDVRVLIAFRGL